MTKNDSLANFKWLVPARGYEWKETYDGLVLFARLTKVDRYRTYYPFVDNPELYLTFSELKRTPEAILEFANTYGWLGWPVTHSFRDGRLAPDDLDRGRYAYSRGEIISSEAWSEDSLDFLRLHQWDDHHAWEDHVYAVAGFRRSVQKRLRGETLWDGDMLSLGMSLGTRHCRVIDHSGRPSRPQLTPKQKAEREAMEGAFIADRATAMLRQVLVFPRVEWLGSVQRLRVALEPVSLIGCLWLQTVMAVSMRFEYRKCNGPGCAKEFEISRDLRTGRREQAQTCSDACRQRLYRYRRKARALERQGQTIRQIARTLGLDLAYIRRWFTQPERERSDPNPENRDTGKVNTKRSVIS
jgi:transposase-like protein